MTRLRYRLGQYLQVRRALGYKLERAGRLLPDFVTFVHQARAAFITTELALAWATQSPRGTPAWAAARLSLVRGFAQYVRALDPRTEIPPATLLPHHRLRRTPYLYSDADVRALMDAAHASLAPFKGATYRTLLGLLASTGIRVGEALALDHGDHDVADGVLRIRHAKFGKARQVPLHPSTGAALTEYRRLRDRIFRPPRSPSFFVSRAGTRLHYKNVHTAFLRLVRTAGLADRRPRRPRLHDLRHSFAMHTLRDWYHAGVDVEARLPWLSTYLGHVGPATTYWYLTATPELVTVAHRRLERFLEEPS
ncbi:MAG: tyrosine-type recombinase/integrase [Gemmatimonadetes bacterium]|nr:tyrosine-type recombinase/integrase [Gemmatimonadota bacterium]